MSLDLPGRVTLTFFFFLFFFFYFSYFFIIKSTLSTGPIFIHAQGRGEGCSDLIREKNENDCNDRNERDLPIIS